MAKISKSVNTNIEKNDEEQELRHFWQKDNLESNLDTVNLKKNVWHSTSTSRNLTQRNIHTFSEDTYRKDNYSVVYNCEKCEEMATALLWVKPNTLVTKKKKINIG